MLQLEVSGVHLNWDRNNKNGIIVNGAYPNGALFTGDEHKPVLSVDYLEFEYTEKGELRPFNYIAVETTQGALRFSERIPFTDELEAEVLALANAWVQPEGQEGNPSLEQRTEWAKGDRDHRIEQVRWRIERHRDQLSLGAQPTEPLEPLLLYVQALRDITLQTGFPDAAEWPTLNTH